MGYEGRTASSTVPEEAVPRLRAAGGKVKPGSKPKVTAEKPAKAAPRKKAPTPPKEAEGNGQVAPDVAAQVVEPATVPEPVIQIPEAAPAAAPTPSATRVPHGATPTELGDRIGVEPTEVIKVLLMAGEMVSVTQSLSDEAIELVAAELGHGVEIVAPTAAEDEGEEEEEVDESLLRPRPPVVTVMGHVDHGKTLLLDAIRKTDVVGGEFGGITQHIGAYQVHRPREVTFIDTPGHEAFTAMRVRGADLTDVVVLVVAADDGVMPQTVEALNHAKAAEVPIIVAVNKVDKEEADPQRVRQQLSEQGLIPVEWGGETEFVDVSAKTGQNLETLIETILLLADLQDLKADPVAPARGVAVEAHLDKGRGPIAT